MLQNRTCASSYYRTVHSGRYNRAVKHLSMEFNQPTLQTVPIDNQINTFLPGSVACPQRLLTEKYQKY